MRPIETERLILRAFRETDYDDLYEFLSQLRQNIFFHRDADGAPVWKDTFVYAMLEGDLS